MLSTVTLLIYTYIIPIILSHDVAIGLNSYGRKIFDENRQASPAIWRQKENVTIQAADNEVISKVLVIDMRPEKDGDAKIVDGGEKKKNVTIELKSPTVFRGYDFHIEVFAVPASHTSNYDTDISNGMDIKPAVGAGNPRNFKNKNNINNENAYESDHTTVTVSTKTTNLPILQSNNYGQSSLASIPEIDKDNKRHIRKIGDDLSTSTEIGISTTLKNTYSTTVSTEAREVGSNNRSMIEYNTNSTAHVDSEENKIDTTTVFDVSTTIETTLIEEFATISPDKNGKDVPDFDDLLSTNKEESRFIRQTKYEKESTTLENPSTTENGETTTIVSVTTETSNSSDNSTDAYETRESRNAQYNESSDNTIISTKYNPVSPILQIIIENGAYDMNIVTANPDEIRTNVPEGSGYSYSSTFTNEHEHTTMASTEININGTTDKADEQLRNVRGTSNDLVIESDPLNTKPNYDFNNENIPSIPVFVDPSTIDKSKIISDDFVYVPIVAVISKQNYPLFQGILDMISKNEATPKLDISAMQVMNNDVIIPDKTMPAISYP